MPSTSHACDVDARCECGSLLARITARGVELKCRRCKRIVVIPLDDPKPNRAPPRAR
jgi:phage FluMu protein Com